MVDAALGPRAKGRLETTAAIKEIARRHLAAEGASGLSLRAVARDLGMVSSAVYRYFPSRDDLLTALIIDAYDEVGGLVEAADAACERSDLLGRWLAVCGTVRRWAVAEPAQYALVYGSPVPGYAAPQDTVGPATRVTWVLVQLLAEAYVSEGFDPQPPLEDASVPAVLKGDLDIVRIALSTIVHGEASIPSDALLARGLAARTHLFGAITFELFGQHQNVITDDEAFFLHAMHLTARTIGIPAR